MNVGFLYTHDAQVNKPIWVDALMEYSAHQSGFGVYPDDPKQSKNKTTAADSLLSPSTVKDSLAKLAVDTLANKKLALDTAADQKNLVIPLLDSAKTKIAKDTINKTARDTSKLGLDSLGAKLLKKDTVKVDLARLDSTARLKYFKSTRKDVPYTTLTSHKPSKFYANPTQRKKVVEIDTTDGKRVVVKEKIGDQQIRQVLSMPLDQYLDMKMKGHDRELWEDLVYKYELKDRKRDLSNVIKDFTDFEIPLPSVGVLSIFGAPKISLKISGAVDIHGAWRNETTEGVTASSLGNSRNEPDFRQQVQINVNGTIGDKLQIVADWNTERTFEYENQLKLKYTGYEDEIIQSIEAGNVSLQTAPLIGGSEALFGIKANFKMGPLNLTALASQKKGEVKEKSVSGGSQTQPFTIRAYNYSKNHYFVDAAYADTTTAGLNLFYKYFAKPSPEINETYRITDIEVWKSINQITADPNEWLGNAYIDLPSVSDNSLYTSDWRDENLKEVPGERVRGRFIKLVEGVDYIVHYETGFITFKTSIQDQDIIAVAYKAGGKSFGEFSKNLDKTKISGVVLKLVKPQNLQPQYTRAWLLQLKNIYPIGARSIKKEGFTLDIKYEVDGGEPQSIIGAVRLLSAFGLDLLDQSGTSQPDGIFDFRPGYTIIPETGEIIFPTLQPFGRNLPNIMANADSLRFNDVYDTTVTFAQQNKIKDKFIITGQSTGEASSSYQLGFNVIENSVRVTLNGRELTAGVDYSVDYNIGTLNIRNEAALVSGANLKISYEENDLFQIASKTLFGLRGILDISKNTKLGFSLLTLSQQTLSDKVRIGEEPLSNSIYGLDFTTTNDLPFMTKFLDKVISTKEMSNFALRGEVALMNPNPNTKTSTISSDNGNNIAYIDDFEGSKRIIPIGVSYTGWKDISVPTDLDPAVDTLTDLKKMNYKGKSWWYNILPSDVSVYTIWPDKKVATADQQITVMDFLFDPTIVGAYNYSPALSSPQLNWGGMMKLVSSTASNLVEENVEFIEFWLNLADVKTGTKLNIDLGRISEDVIPNNKLDTEDKNSNELIDDGEDTGIDGELNAQEQATHGSTDGDPSHDDFSFQSSGSKDPDKYKNINGSEGNAILTDVGRIPDTEDLNHNGTLDKANSYFRYEIPLDTALSNTLITGGRHNGWYQFRIPLKDYKIAVGSPSLTVVEGVRVFVTGVDSRVHFRMTEFNLVGNQWQKDIQADSVLELSVVNIEDNSDYKSPGGVSREKDRTSTESNVYRNEQSLNLIIKDLPEGQTRQAIKYLPRSLDLFNYSEMKLFVHPDQSKGPSSISYFKDITEYASDVFFRFGTDTNNYYEYRQPLKDNSIENNWDEISIVFKELTAIKQARGDTGLTRDYQISVPGKDGHYYIVRGRPALTQIKFLSIGITNKADGNLILQQPVSGTLWVDELRVIGADDTKGWAYSAAASVKFADFVTLNFNISKTDPYFHRLSDRFGSRVESNSWGIAADIDLLKIIPLNSQESNLKLNYSKTESIGKPLFLPNTDILVSEAQRLEKERLIKEGVPEAEAQKKADQIASDAQTFTSSDTYTLSNIKLRIPTNYWLIRDSFNSLTFGFNYNKAFSRNPSTLASKYWIWNANMGYGINISPEFSFTPASIPVLGTPFAISNDYRQFRIYYLPQSFTYTINAKRNRSINVTRATISSSLNEVISRDFAATRGMGFNWKMTENGLLNITTTYSYDASSTLTYLETNPADTSQRSESRIWKDIFTGAFFGKDYQFRQNLDFKTNPKLPNLWDIGKYISITAGYNVSYSWQNDFRQGDLGRSVGYSNKTSLGFNLKLKSLFEPLFKEEVVATPPPQAARVIPPAPKVKDVSDTTHKDIALGDKSKAAKDSLTQAPDSVVSTSKFMAFKNGLFVLKTLVKTLFIDYDNIQVNFSNGNNFASSGIKGDASGFKNFWGVKYNANQGPSRAYMLGLSNNPGPRAANANLTDNFSQNNSIDLRTSKPLWEGARIEISWKVGWSVNKQTTLQSDASGRTAITNVTSTGTLNRSFFSLPPVFFLSFFKSGIKRVNEIYTQNQQTDLSGAFVQGFETLPVLSKLGFLNDFANYIPRPNWRISWDGLEKLPLFKSFAKKVTLDHAYSSDYNEGWKIDPDGKQITQSQKITLGFQPLVGLNMTFFDLWNGNFAGNIKYSTQSGYDVGITTKNITETYSRDIGISVNYSKTGFEVPFFGISLKNDIEFSLSYTNTQNSTVLFDMANFTEKGVPQNGTVRSSLEPRVKYVMSSKVTLSLYYKRTSTTPEGASRITATTTNEAGVDVRISIQ